MSIRKCETVSQFKTKLINLVRPPPPPPPKKSTFKIHDINGIKLLTRIRVEFSDLRSHRFRHNFNCASPLCLCQTRIEDNEHYFLHCPRFAYQRKIMLDFVCRITNINIMRQSSKELSNLLLYGDSNSNVMINRVILEATLKYIKNSRLKKVSMKISTFPITTCKMH